MKWTFEIMFFCFLVFATFPLWTQPLRRWAERKLKELDEKEAREAQSRQ